LPRIGQALSRNALDAYNYLPQSVGEFPAGEALAQRMRQAGLAEVRFVPLSLGIATLYVGTKADRVLPSASATRELAGACPRETAL